MSQELVSLYSLIRECAAKVTKNSHDADDLAGDLFVKLFSKPAVLARFLARGEYADRLEATIVTCLRNEQRRRWMKSKMVRELLPHDQEREADRVSSCPSMELRELESQFIELAPGHKIRHALECVAQLGSIRKASKRLSIPRETLGRWIRSVRRRCLSERELG